MMHPQKQSQVLVLLSVAALMLAIDLSIVNVALPSIQSQFHLTPTNLQWVVSAYALTFGGFLLLGGRASDLFNRKLVFLLGLLLFSIASFFGGLAISSELVFISRALQGLGGALLSPSALSLITTTYPEGQSRNRALAIFSSMATIGFTVGVTTGGILTSFLSWHWVFFVNVPIGIFALIAGFLFIPNPKGVQEKRGFDVAGAVLVTTSLLIIVYTITRFSIPGEPETEIITLLTAAGILAASFIIVEMRASRPLVPLSIFRRRTIVTANLIVFLNNASVAGLIFITTLYLQEIRGFSPLEAGLLFVPAGLSGFISAYFAPRIIKRIGPQYMLFIGLILGAIGIGSLTTISINSSLLVFIISLSVAVVGMVPSIVSLNIIGTTGVEKRRQGLAAGLLTTAQQVGAAIGVSVASVVATAVALSLSNNPSAVVNGYRSALYFSEALLAFNIFLAWYLARRYARIKAMLPKTASSEDRSFFR